MNMSPTEEILVTGGTGFIGSRLVEALLQAGERVRILDKIAGKSNLDATLIGDVRNIDCVRAACAGVKTVYHLAAEHRDNVTPISLYREVNVGGARNLALAADASGVQRIVFTSTVAVYGLENPAANEASTPEPFNEYGRSKLEAETVLIAWAKKDPKRSLTIVRPCVVFGEGNRGNVYNLLRQIHSGRFVMIGTGKNKKSLAYVGNVVGFLANLCKSAPGIAVLNYADKPDLTTHELVSIADKYLHTSALTRPHLPVLIGLLIGYAFDALSTVIRKDLPISSVRVRKFCAETSVSTARLDQSGFARPYTLEEGLRRMIVAEFPRPPSIA